jgi:hypothetical protein
MTTFSSISDLRHAMSGYPENHLARLSTGGEISGPDQRGPCCGLYALQHVYNYWARNGVPECQNAPVVARKGGHQAHVGGGPPTSSLRQYAKQHGLTQIGELLSVDAFCQVAMGTGMFDVHKLPFGSQRDFEQQVKDNLKANCPLALGFDVDGDTGSPALHHGNKAHWTTLVGYATNSRGEMSIAHFHWGEYHLDSAAAFFQSNRQLQLILSSDQKWVKAYDPKIGDTNYFSRTSATAHRLNAQANPVKGDFSNAALRDVSGLVGNAVRLRPRRFDPADLELIGIAVQVCERYEKSLRGFFSVFRNPSEGSKSALRQLRTMLGMSISPSTKATDLRSMLRHFGQDPPTTGNHPTWGAPAGTTLRNYIREAFAGRKHLLN